MGLLRPRRACSCQQLAAGVQQLLLLEEQVGLDGLEVEEHVAVLPDLLLAHALARVRQPRTRRCIFFKDVRDVLRCTCKAFHKRHRRQGEKTCTRQEATRAEHLPTAGQRQLSTCPRQEEHSLACPRQEKRFAPKWAAETHTHDQEEVGPRTSRGCLCCCC